MRENDIKVKVLKEVEHVRHRPGTWIGSTEDSSRLVGEISDNAVDELLNGHATVVTVDEVSEGTYRITDNGRGLPLYYDEEHQVIAAKLIYSKLFSGGKYDDDSMEYNSGLNGVGSTVANALSKELKVRVNCANQINLLPKELKTQAVSMSNPYYFLRFDRGVAMEEGIFDSDTPLDFSTEVTLTPDLDVMKSAKASFNMVGFELAKNVRPESKIIVNGVEVKAFDARNYLEGTLIDDKVFELEVKDGTHASKLHFWFGYSSESFDSKFKGAVNMLSLDQGVHINQVLDAIGKSFVSKLGFTTGRDARVGIRVFSSGLLKAPVFTGQSKERISSYAFTDIVDRVQKEIDKLIDQDAEYFEKTKIRINDYLVQIGRMAEKDHLDHIMSKAQSGKTNRGLGVGIYDCSTTKREDSEIFIVEGKSAAAPLLAIRDRKLQAVMPLRGKPVNTTGMDDLKEILENKEMRSMITALGVGASPHVDMSKARYGKAIILADADADGANIAALITGTFLYLLREWVEAGKLYIIETPLFYQEGKFIWDESQLNKRKNFTRFKGLGELNPTQLKQFTDLALRQNYNCMRQITIGDIERSLNIVKSSKHKKNLLVNKGVLVD